jgi:chromosome segregation ATPase
MAERSRKARPLVLGALALAAAACHELDRRADEQDGQVEPDVFDVIRASNSKAAVEALRDRYDQEVQHARLLEARIGELIAAEEGLSVEHHERLQALQSIRDQVRKLADEQAALGHSLEEAAKGKADGAAKLETLKTENADLEKAIAAETQKQADLKKQLDEARAKTKQAGGGP